jgi:hypothetical protein
MPCLGDMFPPTDTPSKLGGQVGPTLAAPGKLGGQVGPTLAAPGLHKERGGAGALHS